MPLIGPKTLANALATYDFRPSDVQNEAARHWAGLVQKELIQSVKETALEADFKRHIVEDLLGYRSVGSGQEVTLAVKEAIGPGVVDLALGRFSETERLVLAPFELKAPAFRNLDAIISGRAKTPVQQAWEYANDAVGARWVLVSNQIEIRLYAIGRGRQDFEVFDLSKLDDPDALKRLYLMLGAENLLGGRTLELLSASLQEDKDITVKLYREYKALRDHLVGQIRGQLGESEFDEAIRLAQKLMDRVLFTAFAEDTVLLPNNQLKGAVNFSNPYDPQSKWTYLKILFDAIDGGNPRLNIPPYNGGLFARDSKLDALEISDYDCDLLAKIGDYDFKSQVSVSILGHIFEQSITDIERLQAEARGEAPPATTKRKKEGVVYTPEFVTRFIVERTIGEHLAEARSQLLAEHSDGVNGDGEIIWRGTESAFWRAYLDIIKGLKIVDPACGSGAFLVAAFDFLKSEQDRVRGRLLELEPGLLVFAGGDSDTEIITRNLYGVDVNSESVEITKLSLWLKTAKHGRQLESLDRTIQVGNSLIEDSDFHRRAFVWRERFADIFAAGGFDVVIGNPPYVRMELLKAIKPYLERRYEVTADRADLYAYFFELGVRLLKPGGRLGYISSSTFFRTGSGENLRRYLAANAEIEAVVDFGDLQLFEGVTTYPTIITMRRNNGASAGAKILFLNQKGALPADLSKTFEADSRPMPRARLTAGSWRFEDDRLDELRRKITAGRPTLAEVYGAPLYGIKTGFNEAFVLSRATRDALIAKDARSADLLKPFLVGENLKRWHVESDDLWLIYIPKNRVDIDEYPAIRDHLAQFRAPLEARATKQEWFELQQAQAAYEPWFIKRKVLYPVISQGPKFSVDREGRYFNDKVFLVQSEDAGLVSFLGSTVAWYILFGEASPLRGGQWRLELRENRMSHVPMLAASDLLTLSGFGEAIQTVCERRASQVQAFIARSSDLGASGAPLVRDNWPGMDFTGLRIAVRKNTKADIPVAERDEWEAYFNARKAEITALDASINDLEAEINARVYALFDLNGDEIKLIEEALEGQY